ncbi:hypothetical protein NH340_JMT06914 [Sarcoptes scabiei]|uniref:Uncharacterized protein n=1 Tax=Sarcoptes scabiei TaxID=52283 RepID=A0A834RGS6_SARSC|nr:hypothetical protein NH340_JMT06914 [Sarcoptes scabiei]
MLSECELRSYAKGLAYCAIGFSVPYLILSIKIKKTNRSLFRKLLIVPTIIGFHGLTYIPKDLARCREKNKVNH